MFSICPVFSSISLVKAFEDSIGPAAVRHQFCVPMHASIEIRGGHCLENFLVRLHADQFIRLQISDAVGVRLPARMTPGHSRPARAAPDPAEPVVQPAHRTPQTNTGLTQVVVHRIDETADKPLKAHVTGPVVFQVLTNVPPVELGYLRTAAVWPDTRTSAHHRLDRTPACSPKRPFRCILHWGVYRHIFRQKRQSCRLESSPAL